MWVASNQVCASLISTRALSGNWCFLLVGDDGFFGVLVGVGLVSIIDEIVRVFPTSAKQTCGDDKMRHFPREEACKKRNHFVATGNP